MRNEQHDVPPPAFESGRLTISLFALPTGAAVLLTITAKANTGSTQETSKIDRGGDTAALRLAQNDICDHLLTIQNTGDLELPVSSPPNAPLRANLKLLHKTTFSTVSTMKTGDAVARASRLRS